MCCYTAFHSRPTKGSQFNCSIQATKIGINGFGRIGRMVFQAQRLSCGWLPVPGTRNHQWRFSSRADSQFYQRAYQEMVRSWIVFPDFLWNLVTRSSDFQRGMEVQTDICYGLLIDCHEKDIRKSSPNFVHQSWHFQSHPLIPNMYQVSVKYQHFFVVLLTLGIDHFLLVEMPGHLRPEPLGNQVGRGGCGWYVHWCGIFCVSNEAACLQGMRIVLTLVSTEDGFRFCGHQNRFVASMCLNLVLRQIPVVQIPFDTQITQPTWWSTFPDNFDPWVVFWCLASLSWHLFLSRWWGA